MNDVSDIQHQHTERGRVTALGRRTDSGERRTLLQRFKRYTDDADNISGMKDQPTVLLVAPLSGHHSTLLRETLARMTAS